MLVDALVEYGKQLYELGRSKHSFSETVNAVIEKFPHLTSTDAVAYAAGTRGHHAGLGLVEIGFNFVVGFFAMLRPIELLQLSKIPS